MAKKREGYLEWDEYFMGVAFLAAQRSKDPSTQVGACIVNKEKKIVGVGYNGFPIGCSDDSLPWSKSAGDRLETKYPYVCHAELNAIINKNSSDVRGCDMYVTLFPCNECAKLAIQAGIAKIIYLSDKHHSKPEMTASRILFDMVGIRYERFVPKRSQVVIDYDSGMREEMERSILVERVHSANNSRDKEKDNTPRKETENNNVIDHRLVDGEEEEEEEELAPKLDGLDKSVTESPSESPVPFAIPSCASVNIKRNNNQADGASAKKRRLSWDNDPTLLNARILALVHSSQSGDKAGGCTLKEIVNDLMGYADGADRAPFEDSQFIDSIIKSIVVLEAEGGLSKDDDGRYGFNHSPKLDGESRARENCGDRPFSASTPSKRNLFT